ncbi:MAG: hypothetical protein IIB57_10850 [Planctomycetes bacterium]|nr:hypothetical protein [Planctomycetota bacterium]
MSGLFLQLRTEQCEEFIFGCCEGNANNFPTQDACEAERVTGAAGSIPTVVYMGLACSCSAGHGRRDDRV